MIQSLTTTAKILVGCSLGLMLGNAQAAPLPSSSIEGIEVPTFFLKTKATEGQNGKMYFKLPCHRCPKSLALDINTLITPKNLNITADEFFINKDYQADSILYDTKTYKVIRINLPQKFKK